MAEEDEETCKSLIEVSRFKHVSRRKDWGIDYDMSMEWFMKWWAWNNASRSGSNTKAEIRGSSL